MNTHYSETKEKIVEVSRKLFSQKGFDATSMEDIAEEVGIRKPSLYYHFDSKEGIYAVVLDRIMQETTELFGLQNERFEENDLVYVFEESLRRGIEAGAGIIFLNKDLCNSKHLHSQEIRKRYKKMKKAIATFLSHYPVSDANFAAEVVIDSQQMYLIRNANNEKLLSVRKHAQKLVDLILKER